MEVFTGETGNGTREEEKNMRMNLEISWNKILVCGGRNYWKYAFLQKKVHVEYPPAYLHNCMHMYYLGKKKVFMEGWIKMQLF